ncbi:CHRD domain-containing protein [Archangium violaceum]|uniref:CHRD domain-containing protein n=1 Tax=Archangium violaceum TaxID=83451 RepID=UPI0005B89785|nr:CHRD domain-containing protein [Archangium violaceum]
MHTRDTKRWTMLGVLGAGLLALAGCGSNSWVATTQLSGANEVPPTSVPATTMGTATATLDGDKLTVTGGFSGLQSNLQEVPDTGSSVHIHQAAQGVNGPVVFSLAVTTTDQRNGSYTGTKDLSDEEQEAFKDGLFYVNIHTSGNPNGEIRGQFIPIEGD